MVVVLGLAVGFVSAVTSDTGDGRRVTRRHVIGFLVVAAIAVSLPPVDTPAVVDIGLLAAVWGAAGGSVATSVRDGTDQ
ncbi:hypothetical protein [Halopiger goleimassiliensis]|uniref:hypothetical protein n=1 Tax=Halopiger goleimassiliensis TaxID=1293048 RepID=UPI000677B610|nr:hypothetical protein [Halopiger goleimassiliensis]